MTHTSKKGFTLAEVLTTLMVIGVVAAMTIPTLMNSTKDQQDKVAFKKAMSVLGQGAQLMMAKEVECRVKDNDSLAKCFAEYALSGTRGLTTYESTDDSGAGSGTAHTNTNVIVTPDGMAFGFYYNGNNSATGYRSLSDICGERFTGAVLTGGSSNTSIAASNVTSWDASDAPCVVVVDTNGLNKGSKYFFSGTRSSIDAITSHIGSDKFPFILTGTGVVPVYQAGNTATGSDAINGTTKGYSWVYGQNAKPSTSSSGT